LKVRTREIEMAEKVLNKAGQTQKKSNDPGLVS